MEAEETVTGFQCTSRVKGHDGSWGTNSLETEHDFEESLSVTRKAGVWTQNKERNK